MNWKTYVVDLQRRSYKLPEGWDSREDIAEQLDCSPEKVIDHLRPAIKAGEVESKQFDVWDDGLERKVRITAYRHAAKKADKNPTPRKQADPDRAETIKQIRAAGGSWAQVGKALGVSKSSAMKAGRKAGLR